MRRLLLQIFDYCSTLAYSTSTHSHKVDMQTRSQAQASKSRSRHRPRLVTRPKNATKRRKTPSNRVSRCGNSGPPLCAKESSDPLNSQHTSSNLTHHQSSVCSTQLLTLEQIAQLCLSGLPQPCTQQPRAVAVNAENLMGSRSLPMAIPGRLTMPYLDPSE